MTKQLRDIIASVQDGEITVSRALECIEALEAGTYTDDWLPPSQGYFGEDEIPIEVVKQLRAEIEKPKQCKSEFQSIFDELANDRAVLAARGAKWAA